MYSIATLDDGGSWKGGRSLLSSSAKFGYDRLVNLRDLGVGTVILQQE
jgi:hypothetical protein